MSITFDSNNKRKKKKQTTVLPILQKSASVSVFLSVIYSLLSDVLSTDNNISVSMSFLS